MDPITNGSITRSIQSTRIQYACFTRYTDVPRATSPLMSNRINGKVDEQRLANSNNIAPNPLIIVMDDG